MINIASHQAIGNTESMLLKYPAEEAEQGFVYLTSGRAADTFTAARRVETHTAARLANTLSGARLP